MITQRDWDKLEELTQKLGYSSISGLIEALAKQEVSINQLLNIIKQ